MTEEYKKSKEIALQYFQNENRDEVVKGAYAFGDHKGLEGNHSFPEKYDEEIDNRWMTCEMCGRSREEVRYDDLPAQCQNDNPNSENPCYNPFLNIRGQEQRISNIILREEENFHAKLEKAASEVPKLFKKLGENGEALSIIHHTYGFEIDVAREYVDVSAQMEEDYNSFMNEEKSLSNKNRKAEIVSPQSESKKV